MCGLVGILDTVATRPIDRALLDRMNEVQRHRGPDAGGLHVEPGLGLGHRRLSIIDLSSGQQPLYNEDRTVVVVYNGEIYNFQELTNELVLQGHVFRTRCDTEVIVHAWEEWGEECVRRFRGMFAFALWDSRTQTLFLARDRLGIKPLFYAQLADGVMVFASELKALLAHPDLPRHVELDAVEDYFAYGYVPDPKTILKNVRKLPPGYVLTVKRGQRVSTPREYWDVPFQPVHTLSDREAQEELVHRLREAVRLRMIAEVPLGAFLSGGVDSSAVVAMMAGLSAGPINTCSIAFGDPNFNEALYAEQVAARYRTNHYVNEVDPQDIDLVDDLAALYDEPYADSSAIPTYRVCQLARERVTVALSGDGGDEMLAGYRRYRWHTYEERLRSLLPARLRQQVFGVLGRMYPKLDWAPKLFRAKSTLESLARGSVEGYFHSVSLLSDGLRSKLFSHRLRADLAEYHAVTVLEHHANRAPSAHPLSLAQYLDIKTYLTGDILTKVDRASMAHSLEVRVPILDHELVEWMSGLTPEMKLRGREGKHVLKKAMESYLPRNILYRPKMGFEVPLASWFRGPLRRRVRDALLGETLGDTGLFDRNFLKKMLDQHHSGIRDYSVPLWTLLMFEAFQRRLAEA